jgi:hypothetical protein
MNLMTHIKDLETKYKKLRVNSEEHKEHFRIIYSSSVLI